MLHRFGRENAASTNAKTPTASLALSLNRIEIVTLNPRYSNHNHQRQRKTLQNQRGKEGETIFLSLLFACSGTVMKGQPKQKQMYPTFHHPNAQNLGQNEMMLARTKQMVIHT